ncbi:hypothetical protein QBK99_25685 [Corticibacterium sp. UT-5YL-CI-8]|nr:hypothetical protein [Tianweitania sp. UT-5YL-CI-8]
MKTPADFAVWSYALMTLFGTMAALVSGGFVPALVVLAVSFGFASLVFLMKAMIGDLL